MATYSENFSHDDNYYEPGKAGLRKLVEWNVEEGKYEGVEVFLEDVDIAIEEGEATVYPIDYSSGIIGDTSR